jgi:hypothetical protein
MWAGIPTGILLSMWMFLLLSCGSDKTQSLDDTSTGYLDRPVLGDTGVDTPDDTGLGPADGLLSPRAVWVSDFPGFGTGGGFADIDDDGDQDLVVAHGNDMRPGYLAVFENIDGTLDTVPVWTNAEPAYYGHLALGDVDNDGDIDLVVSRFLGVDRFESPGGVEVYLNHDGVLEETPSWQVGGFFSFSVALGDMDGDGFVDLGVAVGESYQNEPGHARVFLGDGEGGFGDEPVWVAPQAHYSFDVAWADFDADGRLELVLAQHFSGHRIYPNVDGMLGAIPMWVADAADGPFEGNTLDVGDVDGDGLVDLVVSDNDQLGGPGLVRLWCGPSLEICHSIPQAYASAVDLFDVDQDGDLDLSYGGWWSPVSIVENVDGVFSSSPMWVSAKTDIVVEALDWADVDGVSGFELMVTDWTEGSGNRLWAK